MRKLAADELGLPTVPFWFAGSVDELTAVAEHAGFPLVVKPIAGVPGEGESVLLRTEDVEAAWQRAVAAGRVPHSRVLAETVVEVDYEITLITVRTTGPTGPALHFCEPIGHRAGDSDLLEAWQPQSLSAPALDAAKSIAARIVNALGGRGVFGVELLVRGDDVYFADVRTRPHDSGLVTLRSQRLSEFELHARAILGLHVDTIMISPGAAEVTYAGAESAPVDIAPENVNAVLGDALAVRGERCPAVQPARRGRAPASARAGAGDRTGRDDRQGQGAPSHRRAAQTLVAVPSDRGRRQADDGPVPGCAGNHCGRRDRNLVVQRFRGRPHPGRPAGRPGRGRPERRAAAGELRRLRRLHLCKKCAVPKPICLRANGIQRPSAAPGSSTTSPTSRSTGTGRRRPSPTISTRRQTRKRLFR